jgi:hypothetical protein
LIDRQLYLPAAWTDDRDCCRAAVVPDEVGFATKVQMAWAFAAGVSAAWVTMDDAYRQSKSLRVWLESRDQAHVVATRRNDDVVTTSMGRARVDRAGEADDGIAMRKIPTTTTLRRRISLFKRLLGYSTNLTPDGLREAGEREEARPGHPCLPG